MQAALVHRGGTPPPGLSRQGAWLRAVGCALALCLAGCDPYDARILKMADPGGQAGTGGGGAGLDGSVDMDGGDEDGGHVCPGVPETCNLEDDDCDGRIDEGADEACQLAVPNSVVQCGIAEDGPRCVSIMCQPGFSNCDGKPENGCEPYCLCHACDDAGTEDGGL